jgi:hypothetical protein
MRTMKRLSVLTAAALVATSGANGYYHFVHYLTRTGPYTQIVEKFDLNALSGKTLQYVISEQGPTQLAANDSFPAVISQIRLAAQAWSDLPSSDLRLAFGGMFTPEAAHTAPVIEIVFGEVPPGLIAYGGPTIRADASWTGGAYVPILRSTVVLRQDLTQRPSWTEGFCLSVGHEIGHALGLQHSLTSSLMSTEKTRGTTKSKPLGADDIAGVSLLYPKADFAATTGSVAGRVAIGADGLHLASVVALSAEGAAISALSNPDGSYQIDGLPPGSYSVYAHPLPPPAAGVESYPANIFPPQNPDGQQIPAIGSFEAAFYPGVKDAALAAPVVVRAGAVLPGIDFNVRRRTAPAIYSVETYSFPGQIAVKPAHLSPAGSRNFIVATGVGLTPSAGIAVVGGAALIPAGGVKPYAGDPRYVQMDFQLNLISTFAGEGPRHLTFTADNDLYVLPSAFRVTRRQPPQVNSVAGGFDALGARQVVVSGSGLNQETRILFDGVPAATKAVDEASSTIVVTPPPAPSGHRAAVVALNADGQSSLFLQSNPLWYEYEFSDTPSITINPSQLAAGSQTMVEIIGANVNFSSQTSIGFSTGDIAVLRVWAVAPNRLLANVAVSTQAPLGFLPVTVINGLRTTTIGNAVQVVPASPQVPQFNSPVTDAASGKNAVPAGGTAAVRLTVSADAPASAIQVSVSDRPASVTSFSAGVLQFVVPADLAPGPAVLRLTVAGEPAPLLAMQVDIPPPMVKGVFASGVNIDTLRAARPGEVLTIAMRGLGDAGVELAQSRVTVAVGIFTQTVLLVAPQNDGHSIQFVLDAGTGFGPQSLVVSVDGRESAPFTLLVRAN